MSSETVILETLQHAESPVAMARRKDTQRYCGKNP